MIRTVLIDLDGTLLVNDMQVFLPAYLSRLGRFVQGTWDPERFIRILLTATQAMVANRDPEHTLRQVFERNFYPALGVDPPALEPQVRAFYQDEFPKLQGTTGTVPGAAELVERAMSLGFEVVIATNPLFPRAAIEQRLAWAGVPPATYRYAEVTSYETYHFAKPHPEFYAEILGRLGRSPDEAVMLGDDLEADLVPARSLGMAVYRVPEGSADGLPGGDLIAAAAWLQEAERHVDRLAMSQPGNVMTMLRGHLAALRGLLSDLPAEAWLRRPAPEEWSPTEIVCHLRDVEREVHTPRIEALRTRPDPFLSAVDSDTWAEERGYRHQSGPQALEEFTAARKQVLAQLEALNPEDWKRRGRHALLGPTNLAEIATIVADHDRLHLDQMRKTLKALGVLGDGELDRSGPFDGPPPG